MLLPEGLPIRYVSRSNCGSLPKRQQARSIEWSKLLNREAPPKHRPHSHHRLTTRPPRLTLAHGHLPSSTKVKKSPKKKVPLVETCAAQRTVILARTFALLPHLRPMSCWGTTINPARVILLFARTWWLLPPQGHWLSDPPRNCSKAALTAFFFEIKNLMKVLSRKQIRHGRM